MKILPRRIRGFNSSVTPSAAGVASSFQAGRVSRLTSDWVNTPTTIDSKLLRDLTRMQARSRDLVDNDSTGKRFIQLSKINIVGRGMRLQMKSKLANGKLDKTANDKIEKAWKEWSKAANCTVTKRMTLRQAQKKAVVSRKMDGETIIQLKRNFKNKFNFAIMFIDPERLDTNLNRARSSKLNEIRLGIEFNRMGEPLFYYFKKDNGSNTVAFSGNTQVGRDHDKVPASEIVHWYSNDRVDQSRGWPEMAAVMQNLKNLSGYSEAELVAARVTASKMGFYIDKDGSGVDGTEEAGDTGNLIQDAEPGAFEQLPPGTEFQAWDPQHPNTAFSDFMKGNKKDIASGLGISYPTLASDLEGVNYSSIRAGVLTDRDGWIDDQDDMDDSFMTPIFLAWLPIQLLNGNIKLPFSRIEKFSNPSWQKKRWPWIDPKKDVEAAVIGLDNQLMSRGEVISDNGGDREDTFGQIAADADEADAAGISLADNSGTPATNSPGQGG